MGQYNTIFCAQAGYLTQPRILYTYLLRLSILHEPAIRCQGASHEPTTPSIWSRRIRELPAHALDVELELLIALQALPDRLI